MAEKWQRWFPFYINEFMGSPAVRGMHPVARAGYLYLLARSWESQDCALSSDPTDLADFSELGDDLWAQYGPRILRKFEVLEDGRLRNEVLYQHWLQARQVFEKRQERVHRLNAKASSLRPEHDDRDDDRSDDRHDNRPTVTETETVTETKELKASLPLASDRPAKKAVRGSRLPEDFAPNDAHAALASELGVDLRDQFARFRDYWLAKPGSQGTKLDWDATLRNWLRQAADRMPRSPTFGKPYAQPHEDPLDRLRRTHGNHAGNAGTRFQTRTERNLDAARQAIAELGGDAADSLGGEPPGDGEPANAETLRSSLVLLPPLRHPASA